MELSHRMRRILNETIHQIYVMNTVTRTVHERYTNAYKNAYNNVQERYKNVLVGIFNYLY